jgi:transcriptional regulator with XRE-family HTH domain
MQKIDAWRKEACVSRDELAERLGVTTATISRWASGSRRPKLSMIARIERVTAGHVRAADWVRAAELADA